jgi:ATP-dependent RNA helicase DeaD
VNLRNSKKSNYSPVNKKNRKYQRKLKGSHEKGMVRFTFSKGKMHGIRPKDVVSKIAFHADIPGHVIGKIDIQNKRTLVDVPERYVDQMLSKSATLRIRKHTVNLVRV